MASTDLYVIIQNSVELNFVFFVFRKRKMSCNVDHYDITPRGSSKRTMQRAKPSVKKFNVLFVDAQFHNVAVSGMCETIRFLRVHCCRDASSVCCPRG